MSRRSARQRPHEQNRSSLHSLWVRRAGRPLLLLLVLTLLARLSVQPVAAQSAESRVLPQLQTDASAHPNKLFRVIITRVNGNRAADRGLQTAHGTKIRDLFVDAFVANLPGAAIATLGQNPAIKFINYDARMLKLDGIDNSLLATLYPGTVNAPSLWPQPSGAGWTGAGVGVAVLDTGINSRLADFDDANGTSRVAVSINFNSNTNSMNDGSGHGTHVAGIVAGNSWYRTEPALQGRYIGIAPEAQLVNVKVSDDSGMSYVSDVVDAIEWVIANRETYNIRVMNLSLISSVAESYLSSALDAAVERAWFNGILVVVAAGNSGPDTMYYPPANDPFVVTVGAADPMDTLTPNDDTLAPWSSYGTSQDGVSKPDVVAPGRYIVAPLASTSCTLATQFPDRIVDDAYIRMSGTSMAAPVVAGVAALAFQAHPDWTNDQLKWLLLNTATPLPAQDAHEVNAAAVVAYDGTPGLANQELTISELLIGPDGATTYTIQQTGNWSTGNWSTANWSTGNWSTGNWSTGNWSTANWSIASEHTVQ
jgi:serine protease AprX